MGVGDEVGSAVSVGVTVAVFVGVWVFVAVGVTVLVGVGVGDTSCGMNSTSTHPYGCAKPLSK